jgi:hypothetical protein
MYCTKCANGEFLQQLLTSMHFLFAAISARGEWLVDGSDEASEGVERETDDLHKLEHRQTKQYVQ